MRNEFLNGCVELRPAAKVRWEDLIPDWQWEVYSDAIKAVRKTGAKFVLGGAFGLAGYTGRLRNTKDIIFLFFRRRRTKLWMR